MRIVKTDAGEYQAGRSYVDVIPCYAIKDTVEITDDVDWTLDKSTLRSNSSELFTDLCKEAESVIRDDAFALIGGRADLTARLIMAQLAHKHQLIPIQYIQEKLEEK